MEETIERKRAVVDLSDLANTLNIESELKSLLNETEDNTTCMWYLICILDGMDKEELLDLAGCNVGKIQDARSAFLKKKYQADSDLVTQVENLKADVKSIVKESKEVRTSIEEGIDKMVKEHIKNAERLVAAKEEIVEMQKRQIIELERKNKRLEEREKQNLNQTEEIQKFLEQMKEEKIEEIEKKENIPNFGTLEKIEHQEENEEKQMKKTKKRISSYLARLDTKRFISQYLNHPDMSEEQKEFFLECLEGGMSVKEIEQFASQNLSVPVMKRLSHILEEKKKNKR